jgi:DNA-binding MarR family transcriptional regulator
MAYEDDPIERARCVWEENEGPAPDHFAAMAAVLRLEQLMGAVLDRTLREHELSRTGYLILITLYLKRDRTLSMGQLSKRLVLHPTTVSLVTDKLQRRQLVSRSPSPTDRRAIFASLTAEGVQTVSTVSRTLSEVNYGLEGVNSRTAIALTEMIRQVRQSMGDADD